jgi:indole-3-glycerol phosphate synthase
MKPITVSLHPDPADVLRKIVDRRRRRMDAIRAHPDAVAELAPPDDPASGPVPLQSPAVNPFLGALAAHRGRAVVAEVKMGSPRIGSLVDRVDPEAQARLYAEHGAAALSVVVEPDFFHGSYGLLSRCRRASGLPAIAKDFVVDPLQLRWAADAGADAVLLIAALYPPEELRRLARIARSLGLAPLVETHEEAEIDGLAGPAGADSDPGWELVGINNRDLRTFEVDIERSRSLVPRLPAGALKVAESGIGSGADVAALREAGFDAFLVGESLLLADDPAAKLRELMA